MPTITLPKKVNTRDTIWTLLVKWCKSNPLTAGWSDSFPFSQVVGSSQIINGNLSYSMPVTIGKTGNAVGLRIGIGFMNQGVSGDGLKMGLYTSGGVLLGSTVGSIGTSDANTIKEFSLSPAIPVTAGNYIIAFSVNSSGGDSIDTNNLSGSALFYNVNYASFPPANLPGSSPYGVNFFMGVLVQ